MKNAVKYKGYVIVPRPWHLMDGRWNTEIVIQLYFSGSLVEQEVIAANVWETEEEAIKNGLLFGAKIIDREIPSCRLDF